VAAGILHESTATIIKSLDGTKVANPKR
jgi:hypothetical protein